MTKDIPDNIQKLLQANDVIRDFVDAPGTDGFWFRDFSDSDKDWISPQFRRVFGYDTTIQAGFDRDFRNALYPVTQADTAVVLQRQLADPTFHYDAEFSAPHADGHTVRVRHQGHVVRDSSGAPVGLFVVQSKLDATTTGGEVILLVDDETMLLDLMTDQLESIGYQVVPASSGVSALLLVDQGLQFDVLISDVAMPGGISGNDLVGKVRELRPDVPAVLLSGYSGKSDLTSSDTDTAFIQKPCHPTELSSVLDKILGKSNT